MHPSLTQFLKTDPCQTIDSYSEKWKKSIDDPDSFWREYANNLLTWETPFTTTLTKTDTKPKWFLHGRINAALNCIDRHLPHKSDQTAIIWVAEDPNVHKNITYADLQTHSCMFANFLQHNGTKKGECITLYLPMIPELAYTVYGAVRIGAVHNIVFAGFHSKSLAARILDSGSQLIVTADYGVRTGKKILLLDIVVEAIDMLKEKHNYAKPLTVLVVARDGAALDFKVCEKYDDVKYMQWCENVVDTSFVAPVACDSNDALFYLYTSGSTGKPKGLVHTVATYLLESMVSLKVAFDIRQNDVFGCMADAGWITGHTYTLYGPLLLGITSIMFEGTPFYPTNTRYWEIVDKFKVTQLFLAPTVIRMLKVCGAEIIRPFDLSSLRSIGSVGEPISAEAWRWYYENVGRSKCTLVDGYFQTETGGILLASIPPYIQVPAGKTGYGIYGVNPVLFDIETGERIVGKGKKGALCIDLGCPGIADTVLNDDERFRREYFAKYPGYYFTGDSAEYCDDGMSACRSVVVRGRLDDIINYKAHRLSTEEMEGCISSLGFCNEVAVIGVENALFGHVPVVFLVAKEGTDVEKDQIRQCVIREIEEGIGNFARPGLVVICRMLPKTRSGKIVRRLLRKICESSEDYGDLSTLLCPEVVELLKEDYEAQKQFKTY